MNRQTIYDLLARRAEQAGVRAFSPHDMRRSFILDLLDAGADIATVQKLAGHASVQTTACYDRRGDEAKRPERVNGNETTPGGIWCSVTLLGGLIQAASGGLG